MQEYLVVDRRWTLTEERPLGTTSIETEVPAGRYMLTFDAPGHLSTRHPVVVRRGKKVALDLSLPAGGALDENDVYIPGGWCVVGGDPLAPEPFPRER
ncbi:MAG: hypothetical protein AAGE52_36885, partial [Myxococcota bacterium]